MSKNKDEFASAAPGMDEGSEFNSAKKKDEEMGDSGSSSSDGESSDSDLSNKSGTFLYNSENGWDPDKCVWDKDQLMSINKRRKVEDRLPIVQRSEKV